MRKNLVNFVFALAVVALVAAPGFAQSPAAEFGASPSSKPLGGSDCAGGLIVDDGTAENGYSGNPAVVSNFVVVELLTPPSYPYTIDTVCIAFVTLAGTNLDGTVEFFATDGPGGAPGTSLGSVPYSIAGIPGGLPPAFYSFDVSSLGITVGSGSIYVGSRHNPMTFPSRFVGSSENGGSGAGYIDFNTGSGWQPIAVNFPNYDAMLIRAEGTVVPVELQSFDID